MKLEICSRSNAPTGPVTVPSKWMGWADSSTVNSASAGIVTSGEGGGTASAAGASRSHIMSKPTMAVPRAAKRLTTCLESREIRAYTMSTLLVTISWPGLSPAHFTRTGRVAAVVCMSNLLC